MQKITLKIDGMMCGMCESHINDVIRRTFPVKKVSSSHSKAETVIVTDADIPEDALRKALDAIGYRLQALHTEPYEKKGFLKAFR